MVNAPGLRSSPPKRKSQTLEWLRSTTIFIRLRVVHISLFRGSKCEWHAMRQQPNTENRKCNRCHSVNYSEKYLRWKNARRELVHAKNTLDFEAENWQRHNITSLRAIWTNCHGWELHSREIMCKRCKRCQVVCQRKWRQRCPKSVRIAEMINAIKWEHHKGKTI